MSQSKFLLLFLFELLFDGRGLKKAIPSAVLQSSFVGNSRLDPGKKTMQIIQVNDQCSSNVCLSIIMRKYTSCIQSVHSEINIPFCKFNCSFILSPHHWWEIPHVAHNGPRCHHVDYVVVEGILPPEGIAKAKIKSDSNWVDYAVDL